MNYNRLNNIIGWGIFAVAMITYYLTAAPTASFWDCGEFIAVSHELEVPHPPGAPLFLMIGRLVTMLAGDVTEVAFMMNLLSGLFSAMAVLFTFWVTTILCRKIIAPDNRALDLKDMVTIFGSGAVAALAMAWSDTFWFSAVEAEVYAPSSMFIILVFWLMLKWEARADLPDNLRWIVLTAYVIGLSIGVHLMALVILPGLGMIYYFRKYKFSWNGLIITLISSLAILLLIQVGVIQKTWDIARTLELKMAGVLDPVTGESTGMGLGQGAGLITFIVLLVGLLGYGIYYAQRRKKVILSTAIICLLMVYLGFTSYTMIFIRSAANPPIDENNPENVITMLSYLKREQYGDRPLFYGPQYNSPRADKEIRKDEVGEFNYIVKKGESRYIRDTPKMPYYENGGRYFKLQHSNERYFPRMHDASKYNGVSPYNYSKVVDNLGPDPNNPQDDIITGGDNISFYMRYQLGYMFMRYFMWNFSGRFSDIQWGPYSAEWESGVMGTEDNLPENIAKSGARNHYFYLPLLLGLFGMVFHFQKRRYDAAALLAMWIMAGIGIATFLNMGPQEPRERDYAFVGAMQLFCIWIGMAVAGLADMMRNNKSMKGFSSELALIIAFVAGPGILVVQNWDDHDRSGRYVPPDSAHNLLNSCKENAILFTNGDNDTFPLWYIQEVEGVRRDVRIVNLSLANTDWYMLQMKQPMNGAMPVPISYDDNYLLGEKNQAVLIKERMIEIPVDREAIIRMGIFEKENYPNIADTFRVKIGNNNYRTYRKDDMIYNIIENVAKDGWKRPVYFATTIAPSNYQLFDSYLQQEGLAYRVVPQKAPSQTIALQTMYDNMIKNFKYRGLADESVYYDDNTANMIMNLRLNFFRLSDALLNTAEQLENQNSRMAQESQALKLQYQGLALSPEQLKDSIAKNTVLINRYRKMAKETISFADKTISDKAIPHETSTLAYYGKIFARLGEKQKALEYFAKAEKRGLQQAQFLAGYYSGQNLSPQEFQSNSFYREAPYALIEVIESYKTDLNDKARSDALMTSLLNAVQATPNVVGYVQQIYEMRLREKFQPGPAPAQDSAKDSGAVPVQQVPVQGLPQQPQ